MKINIDFILFISISSIFIAPNIKAAEIGKRLRCYFGSWSESGSKVNGFEFLPGKKSEICLGPNDVCLTQKITKYERRNENEATTTVMNFGQCIDRKLCETTDYCSSVQKDFPGVDIKSCAVECCADDLCNDQQTEDVFEEPIRKPKRKNKVSKFKKADYPCKMRRESHDSCCGKTSYNSNYKYAGCCRIGEMGTYYHTKRHGCCNGILYRLEKEKCLNEKIVKVVDVLQRKKNRN